MDAAPGSEHASEDAGAGRPSRGPARRWLAPLVVLAVATAWLTSVGCHTLAAARLLNDALRPAHELAGRVARTEEHVDGTAVLVFRPIDREGALPGVLLCHGAVDAGAYDSRLVALAQALALRGFHVACPDLPALREFRADADDVERLVRVAAHLAAQPARVEAEHLSFAGISVGGSYCLVAAARPEIRERVRAVLAFGAYDDLERLLRSWMVAPRSGVPELYDPLIEGRRRVLLGNLDGLAPPEDREALHGALLALLAGEPGREVPGLSAAGARVLACATSTEPLEAELADAVIAPLGPTLRALSPARDGGVPAARVFLLHGESDPIVPPSDAAALRATLEPLGARVRVHVTDAFTHVAAGERPALASSLGLAWFVAGFLSAAGL